MKKARELHPVAYEERRVWQFDLREIDASPPSFWTRKYLARLDAMLGALETQCPRGGTVLDLACAQGNVAILAAERGYQCIAVDLRVGFVTYARKKEERSVVSWVVGDVLAPPMRASAVDLVVLGEVVEHVAEPGKLLRIALSLVRPGGALIVTTPNGACLRNRKLPSYKAASKDPESLHLRQCGPAGEDHLFALRPQELVRLVPRGAEIASLAFVGSALWSRATGLLAPSERFSWLLERLSQVRFWRSWLCETVVLVLRRSTEDAASAA